MSEKKESEKETHNVRSQGQSGGITAGRIEAKYVAAGDIHVTENSTAEEVLQLLDTMKAEIDQLKVSDKEKRKAERRIEDAIDEAQSEGMDKGSIQESLVAAGNILEKAGETALKATVFGELLSQGLIWAGRATGWL